MKYSISKAMSKSEWAWAIGGALLLMLVIGMWFALVVPSAGAHEGPHVSASPDRGLPGQSVTISGDNFPDQVMVVITLKNNITELTFTEITTDDNGNFEAQISIPSSITPGAWSWIGTAPSGITSLEFAFVVDGQAEIQRSDLAGQETTTVLRIERSNAETIVIGIIIVSLILAGTTLILVATRPRRPG